MPGDILLFGLFDVGLWIALGNVVMRASCSKGDEAGLETLLFLVALSPAMSLPAGFSLPSTPLVHGCSSFRAFGANVACAVLVPG